MEEFSVEGSQRYRTPRREAESADRDEGQMVDLVVPR